MDIFRHYFLETSKQLLSWLTGSEFVSDKLYAAGSRKPLPDLLPDIGENVGRGDKSKTPAKAAPAKAADTEATGEDADIALEDLCDGKNTVCCDTIAADGSFECYTKALPPKDLNSGNAAPYHLYMLNKTDMKFSGNVDEPINKMLRCFRDVPIDLATVSTEEDKQVIKNVGHDVIIGATIASGVAVAPIALSVAKAAWQAVMGVAATPQGQQIINNTIDCLESIQDYSIPTGTNSGLLCAAIKNDSHENK